MDWSDKQNPLQHYGNTIKPDRKILGKTTSISKTNYPEGPKIFSQLVKLLYNLDNKATVNSLIIIKNPKSSSAQ